MDSGSFRYLQLSLFFLTSFILQISAVSQRQQRSAVLVGTVYCNTCFQQESSNSSRFIPGASVVVECCINEGDSHCFRKEARTNRHGVFQIRLPIEAGRSLGAIKSCSVEMVRSSKPFCSVSSSVSSSGLRLKSRRKNGTRIFSAGFFTFKPLNQPELCYQEPEPASLQAREKRVKPEFFIPPPIPALPLPPNVGGMPLPPPFPFWPSPPSLGNVPSLPSTPLLPGLPPTAAAPPPALRFPQFPFPLIFPANHPAFPSRESSYP
ncbi:Olee1-like protein [Apostasia shenzhenica]|uniref:Olee1-like protein n=1 Tax=Apostasia shenzhenica TaxID=1088818 RepID=A0A2I0ADW1_9ASPA|nr:Olee1-like protein [Apostasia shenzhenica]